MIFHLESKRSPLHRSIFSGFLRPLLVMVCLFGLVEAAKAAETISLTAHRSTVQNYTKILAKFNGDPLKVTSNLPPGTFDRTEVELVIIAKALRLGGMHKPLSFVDVSNARRAVTEVGLGNVVMTGQPFNLSVLNESEIRDNFYISHPVSRIGEFEKLIYCLETNEELLQIKSADELNRKGRGIIGLDWDNDARILGDIGIQNIIQTATFPSMIKMILAGRADWIPMEASNAPGMVRIMEGNRFVPIPGIKISLIESRHFMVSRNHPDGLQVFLALQDGLKKLRDEGFICAILNATGFFAEDTLDWKVLNRDAVRRETARQSAPR